MSVFLVISSSSAFSSLVSSSIVFFESLFTQIKKCNSIPYRQKVVLVLPKHLNADNMAVRQIAKELRVTRVKNSSRGACDRNKKGIFKFDELSLKIERIQRL